MKFSTENFFNKCDPGNLVTFTEEVLKGNAQFIFLCNLPKLLVNVCLMKILKGTITKISNCVFS